MKHTVDTVRKHNENVLIPSCYTFVRRNFSKARFIKENKHQKVHKNRMKCEESAR